MTTILHSFSPRHIPSVFIATAFTLGGLYPFWAPADAMRSYGLPERLATAPTAATPFAIYGSRTTLIGVALHIFYARGDYWSVDTILSCFVIAGAADGYLCWKEGLPGTAWFRFLGSLAFGFWGLLGLTSG